MCVKLIKNQKIEKYDQNKPLEEQLVGCSQVLFDCTPGDKELSKFFQEMYKLVGDIDVNEVARIVSSNFQKAEDKLEEISMICANRE